MASAENRVIAGAFKGKSIKYKFLDRYVTISDIPTYMSDAKGLSLNFNTLEISKSNVKAYELVTEEKIKSGSSAIIRGALGAAVLGPVGILAGLTAKNKGIHTLAIEWMNDQKSLIEIDEKIYKQIMTSLF